MSRATSCLIFSTVLGTATLQAQIHPALSLSATRVAGYVDRGLGVAIHAELPIVSLAPNASMMIGAAGWWAHTRSHTDDGGGRGFRGGGAFVGVRVRPTGGARINATLSGGVEWLWTRPDPRPPGIPVPGLAALRLNDAYQAPARTDISLLLGLRLDRSVGGHFGIEGGIALNPHRLDPASAGWGSRLELGVRYRW